MELVGYEDEEARSLLRRVVHKNPLKITNQAVADAVLYTIRKYGTEDQSNKALAIMSKIIDIP